MPARDGRGQCGGRRKPGGNPTDVIRVKNVRSDDLDKAVDSLLEEFGLSSVTLLALEKPTHNRDTSTRRDSCFGWPTV